MGYRIYEKDVVGGRNTLELTLTFEYSIDTSSRPCFSKEYNVSVDGGCSVLFQIMVDVHTKNSTRIAQLFIKFSNHELDDKLIYALDYDTIDNNSVLEHVHKNLTTDDGTWRLMQEFGTRTFTLKFSLKITVSPSCKRLTQCASLHEDTELTDFELRGEDGSVHLHKAIAAAASPVLRRMFAGDWRETAEGVVEVPDTTKATLQQFKDYIYLDTIPDSGVEQLMLLAKCYMMEDLEQRCVDKLRVDVTEETAHHLISFAIRHHLDKLLLALLRQMKKDSFNMDNMETFLLTNMKRKSSSSKDMESLQESNKKKRRKCSSK